MEGRRRITLYDQMTAGNSTSLADLILNDNVVLTDQNIDDTTAGGGGSCQLGQSRTLIDILHEDERHDNNNNNNSNNETTSDQKSRKALNFMDKLRLKLTLTLNPKPNYNSNNNNNNNDNNYELTQQGNTHQQQNDVVSTEPEIAAEVSEVSVAVPVGVSLMDLLEETDVETGFEVSSYRMSDADCEEGVNECEGEENGGEEKEGAGVVERNCCVCMVRHKGAAFIPCGHTFCRACSREVWVSRGNCPLCNNFILEILDIF